MTAPILATGGPKWYKSRNCWCKREADEEEGEEAGMFLMRFLASSSLSHSLWGRIDFSCLDSAGSFKPGRSSQRWANVCVQVDTVHLGWLGACLDYSITHHPGRRSCCWHFWAKPMRLLLPPDSVFLNAIVVALEGGSNKVLFLLR